MCVCVHKYGRQSIGTGVKLCVSTCVFVRVCIWWVSPLTYMIRRPSLMIHHTYLYVMCMCNIYNICRVLKRPCSSAPPHSSAPPVYIYHTRCIYHKYQRASHVLERPQALRRGCETIDTRHAAVLGSAVGRAHRRSKLHCETF